MTIAQLVDERMSQFQSYLRVFSFDSNSEMEALGPNAPSGASTARSQVSQSRKSRPP